MRSGASNPLGIERASHIGVVVRDLPAAKRLYCHTLGGTLIHEEEISGRKQSAFVAIGEDSVVELIQSHSPASLEGQDLEKNGEGIHSLIFKTSNLDRARDFLKAKTSSTRIRTEQIRLSSDRIRRLEWSWIYPAHPANDPR